MRALPALVLALLLPACGQEAPVEAQVASGDEAELIWETPPLPGPSTLSIDGEAVQDFVLEEYLSDEWSRAFLSAEEGTPVEEIADAFYAEPADMLAPLVRDWLLLREHLERFPGAIDSHEFEHFTQAFRVQTGAAATLLEDRIGSEALQAHLERQFRVREMIREFVAGVTLTEEEVVAEHTARLERQAAEGEFSVEELRANLSLDDPNIRNSVESGILERRAEAAIDVWLAELLPVTVVEFSGPDGRLRVLDVPVQSRAAQGQQE